MAKVSCYIPSYNLGHLIGRAIDSVLAQTFEDWELIIEDDGSTDNSRAVIESYTDPRIKATFRPDNIGATATTNSITKRLTGEYIAPLCADDYWHDKEKLAKQVALLDERKEVGIVFSWPDFADQRQNRVAFQDPSVQKIVNIPKEAWQKRFMIGNCLFISTAMWRNALHWEVGYFDECLKILPDLDFYIRVVKNHELHVMPEMLATVVMRDNNENMSAPRHEVRELHADEIRKIRERYLNIVRGKKKYMIATPFYEVKGWSPYIRSMISALTGLAKHTDVEFDYVELSGDSYVWRARNKLADQFLKSECSHLIFIDSDEGFDPESFYRLLKADAPIVGAGYPVKNNWEHYGVTMHVNEDATPKVREDGLIYADKVPTGFMKISRQVFDRIRESEPENWYWEPDEFNTLNKTHNYFGHILEDHVVYGEDISFCKRWTRIGGELFVEPRATIEHWGAQCWKGNLHDFLCRQPGGSKDPAKLAA